MQISQGERRALQTNKFLRSSKHSRPASYAKRSRASWLKFSVTVYVLGPMLESFYPRQKADKLSRSSLILATCFKRKGHSGRAGQAAIRTCLFIKEHVADECLPWGKTIWHRNCLFVKRLSACIIAFSIDSNRRPSGDNKLPGEQKWTNSKLCVTDPSLSADEVCCVGLRMRPKMWDKPVDRVASHYRHQLWRKAADILRRQLRRWKAGVHTGPFVLLTLADLIKHWHRPIGSWRARH